MGWVAQFLGLEKHDATPSVTAIGFPTSGGLIPYGVTATSVLGLPSVTACIRVIRNAVSQLEWRESRGTADLPLSRLVERPQAERTRREWVMLVTETLILYETCYLLHAGGLDSEGVPMSLIPIPPDMITPKATDPWSFLPPDEFYLGNRTISRDQLTILHTGLHPGIPDHLAGAISLARASFAKLIAAENYQSRYWQTGGSPTTQITSDQELSQAQADEIANRWTEKRSQGPDRPAVFGRGAKAEPFGADVLGAGAIEAMKEMDAVAARHFGIPTRLINAPTGDTETYTASGDTNLDLVRFTVTNYTNAIEDGISDLLPGHRRLSIPTVNLTRGSQLARYQAAQLATGGKAWMTPENVREAEDMAPLEQSQLDELNPPPMLGVGPTNGKQPQGAAPAKLTAPRVG